MVYISQNIEWISDLLAVANSRGIFFNSHYLTNKNNAIIKGI